MFIEDYIMIKQLEVEKVLRRRIVGLGTVEFLIQWKGLPFSKNTWKEKNDLNISDQKLIDLYELEFNEIQKKSSLNIESMSNILSQSQTLNQFKPNNQLMIQPLKQTKTIPLQVNIDESFDMKAIPEKLKRIAAIGHKMYFVVQWKVNDTDMNDNNNNNNLLKDSMVSYQLMRETYPYLVIEFFERRLKLGNSIVNINHNKSEYLIVKPVKNKSQ